MKDYGKLILGGQSLNVDESLLRSAYNVFENALAQRERLIAV